MKPGFHNAGMGPFYCNDSVSVEGMLGFFPDLRALVDIIYVDFPRPRRPIVELLGENHQSVPVLFVGGDVPAGVHARRAGDVTFIADEKQIRAYLSAKFDLPIAG